MHGALKSSDLHVDEDLWVYHVRQSVHGQVYILWDIVLM